MAARSVLTFYTVHSFLQCVIRSRFTWRISKRTCWACVIIFFSSLCRDKLGKDDYIGTTYITLSEISASGDNGKCFIACNIDKECRAHSWRKLFDFTSYCYQLSVVTSTWAYVICTTTVLQYVVESKLVYHWFVVTNFMCFLLYRLCANFWASVCQYLWLPQRIYWLARQIWVP